MTAARREHRGIDRVAASCRGSVVTIAVRGFVIAGLAGVAWILGATAADAAVIGEPTSSDSLVPATASVVDEAVSTSEQAARSIQSNQPGSGGSSNVDVAESLVSVLSDETGNTLDHATDAGRGGRETQPSTTGEPGARSDADESSVRGLMRDLTRPSSLEETVDETTDPLAGLTDEVAAPLSEVTRSVVTPISDGVNQADETVSGLLDRAADPVSDRGVVSILGPLADTASLTDLIEPGSAASLLSTPNTLRTVAADAAFDTRHASGDTAVSGTAAAIETGETATTGSVVTGARDGAQAPTSLPLSPRHHIPGVFSGGSTTGNGTATDRGAPDAGAACIGYAAEFGTHHGSRVRPDMSTMGRPSELIADPAVSPD